LLIYDSGKQFYLALPYCFAGQVETLTIQTDWRREVTSYFPQPSSVFIMHAYSGSFPTPFYGCSFFTGEMLET